MRGVLVFQQWHFVDSTAIHFFAVLPIFPKEKVVQTSIRSWCHLPAPVWTPLWPCKKQLKGTMWMWAHSLDVSQWFPDSGSNNARRMADSFMPAESNALWSCDLVQKGRRSGKPSRHLIEEAGGDERRWCPAECFSHLHNLLIFKELPLACGRYRSPHPVHHHPHYTESLGFSHCQPFFFLTLKWAACLASGGKKCVQLRHPCANSLEDDAA